jgi:PEP-CTERM/exosortase A-associated glycosyltransferase
LKALHVFDHSLPLYSGYSFRSRSLLRALRDRGLEVAALTSPKHEASFKGDSLPQEDVDGVLHYRTGPVESGRLPLLGELRLMRALGRRFVEVVRLEKPSLIHVHSPVLNVWPVLGQRRGLRLPVVYEIRAFWEDAAADHGTYAAGSWKYRLVRAAETRACRRAEQVIALCEGIRGDLLARGIPGEKIAVVPNGVDESQFQPGPPDEELSRSWGLAGRKVIGFLGSFYRYEGLDLLLSAFAGLAAARPDCCLLLAGGGDLENELKDRVRSLGLLGKVILPGRIDPRRIPGVYALIDILAYPRYASRLTDLVTPLKPLEAMATGRALVASDVGGHRELIRHGETGLLFPAGDAAALARSLETLLDDPGLRGALGRRGIDWVRTHHTWAKTTAAYPETYARALGARGD